MLLLLCLFVLKFTTGHMVMVSILYAFEGCLVLYFILPFRRMRLHNQYDMGHFLWTILPISLGIIRSLVSIHSCFKNLLLLLPLSVLNFTTGRMVVVSVYAFEGSLLFYFNKWENVGYFEGCLVLFYFIFQKIASAQRG